MVWMSGCRELDRISGHIDYPGDHSWKRKVYLIDPVNFDGIAASYLGKVIDSSLVNDQGAFSFRTLPEMAGERILLLSVQKQAETYMNKLENDSLEESNYFPLVFRPDAKVVVKAKADQFQKSFEVLNPSVENQALMQLRDVRFQAYDRYLSGNHDVSRETSDLLEVQKAFDRYQEALIQFADTTGYLFSALTAIRWASPDANYERIPEFIFRQCEKWSVSHRGHPFVDQLCHHARRENLPLMLGDTLPDFPLPMLTGDTVSVQKLLGRRLTILDLWASWCLPCRRENREYLVPIWDTYHRDGLQIVGYALDASYPVWEKAIKKDGADRWLHASHLNGDDAPFLQALNIVTIPANFIVDERGVVIAKNLHGQDLIEFIKDYQLKF